MRHDHGSIVQFENYVINVILFVLTLINCFMVGFGCVEAMCVPTIYVCDEISSLFPATRIFLAVSRVTRAKLGRYVVNRYRVIIDDNGRTRPPRERTRAAGRLPRLPAGLTARRVGNNTF